MRRATSPCHAVIGRNVVAAEPDSGEAELRFDVSHDLTNSMGNVQGGFLAALLDSTMGLALATTLTQDESPPSVEMKINFMRPGKVGPIVGHGRVVHRTRTLAFVEGQLLDPAGELIATASATHKIVGRRDA